MQYSCFPTYLNIHSTPRKNLINWKSSIPAMWNLHLARYTTTSHTSAYARLSKTYTWISIVQTWFIVNCVNIEMFGSSRHLLPSIGDGHAILPKKFQVRHARIELPHMWLGPWKRILSLRQWSFFFHRMEFSWIRIAAKWALMPYRSLGFKSKLLNFL